MDVEKNLDIRDTRGVFRGMAGGPAMQEASIFFPPFSESTFSLLRQERLPALALWVKVEDHTKPFESQFFFFGM